MRLPDELGSKRGDLLPNKSAAFWAGYRAVMRADDIGEWFDEEWVRISSEGNIMGSCGDRSSREGKPKCVKKAKAQRMTKAERRAAVRRKRREDPNEDRKGKAKMVSTEGRK